MICSSCGSDSPRASMECVQCGAKLSVIRCRCGFLNSLMDSYCGSCGKQLMKGVHYLKTQRTDHSATPVAPFTEQELMRILEVQQLNAGGDQPQNAVTQTDIDKLFD